MENKNERQCWNGMANFGQYTLFTKFLEYVNKQNNHHKNNDNNNYSGSGRTRYSFKKLWQMLIHLVKIKILKQNEMQMVHIDLKIMVYVLLESQHLSMIVDCVCTLMAKGQRLVKNLHKIKSQIRESASDKHFTNQLRSRSKQLKQNSSDHKNLQSFWIIPWIAVLYNNDINHCWSMISSICSLDYHDIHDSYRNHKIYHEIEGAITVVTHESQQLKSRERRSSQSKEKEKLTYCSIDNINVNLSPLNESEEENVFTNESIVGNGSADCPMNR